MLTMFIKKQDVNEIVYTYTPEGKGESGEVSYNFNTKEYGLKESKNDQFKRYGFHAVSKLTEYVEKNKFETQSVVAWC